MKFKYINNTPEAPKTAEISGYKFELEGEAVEVKEQNIINKLLGMSHAGILAIEEQKDTENRSKDDKLKEYNDLKTFVKENSIQVSDYKIETLKAAKKAFENGINQSTN